MSIPAPVEHVINSETKILEYKGELPFYCVMKKRTMCLIPYWTCTGCYSSMQGARANLYCGT